MADSTISQLRQIEFASMTFAWAPDQRLSETIAARICASVGFFTRAGFYPPELFVVMSITMELICGIGLTLGIGTKYLGVVSAGMMAVAAYAIIAIYGLSWFWGGHGIEYLVFWAIASLAGSVEVFGLKYRYADGMLTSTSYAWTGLMAALIANLNPVGMLVVSIFLAGLQIGGSAIQRSLGIPLEISTIIQCCITLFVSIKLVFHYFKKRKAGDLLKKVSETV